MEVSLQSQADGEKELKGKQVIMALGYRADNKLYSAIANQVNEIYNVGDSKKPANIMEGIWDAYNLCLNL